LFDEGAKPGPASSASAQGFEVLGLDIGEVGDDAAKEEVPPSNLVLLS
jgi:hypothetical protein